MEAGGGAGPHRFQVALNQELIERGELVDAQGLAGPDAAKFVVWDGSEAPRSSPTAPTPSRRSSSRATGSSTSSRLERAIEIAAKASAAPGPGGAPILQPIEVREVMGAPEPEM